MKLLLLIILSLVVVDPVLAMQEFRHPTTGEIYAFDDNITRNGDGNFIAPNGKILTNVPNVLTPYTRPPKPAEEVLAEAREAKLRDIERNFSVDFMDEVLNNPRYGNVKTKRANIKSAIANATTVEEVEDINW